MKHKWEVTFRFDSEEKMYKDELGKAFSQALGDWLKTALPKDHTRIEIAFPQRLIGPVKRS